MEDEQIADILVNEIAEESEFTASIQHDEVEISMPLDKLNFEDQSVFQTDLPDDETGELSETALLSSKNNLLNAR